MKRILTLIMATMMLFSFVSCEEIRNGNEEKSIDTKLADNILSHIGEWESISDGYTKEYTYDNVEASGMNLFTTNTQGKFYLSILYTIKTNVNSNSYTLILYHRVYRVTETEFTYSYGSEYSIKDKIVEKCYLLSSVTFSSNDSSKEESVKKLAYNGLEAEQKYFENINLQVEDNIELTSDQQLLFDNMYKAIKEYEYYKPRSSGYNPTVPLAKVEYYIVGRGMCEALLYHGYTNQYGGSYYVGGYLISNQGVQRLAYSDEQKLQNTSKIITLKWDVNWTEEKKVYMLKKSVFDHLDSDFEYQRPEEISGY